MPQPTDEALRVHGYAPEALLRHGAVYKARVVAARRVDGREVIVKDLSPMAGWFKRLFGRRVMAREARALEALAGCPHVPELVERLGRDALALARVAGHPLRKRLPPRRARNVLADLERAVAAIHARGIAHLDLRQRRNILVDAEDRVTLIDFESSWNLRQGASGRLLRGLFQRIDRQAVLKWKARLAPASLTEDERKSVSRFLRWKRLWPFKKASKHFRRWIGVGRKARLSGGISSSSAGQAPTNGAGTD